MMVVGAIILSIVVSVITIYVAILLGGVLSSTVADLFTQFNVTGVWQNLFTQTGQIATAAISVAVIGFLIAAFMIVISMFAGGKKT
ncbi:MAG: hypothetical protein QXL14_03525 [Candidatus Aenigmatarchaeota archaeon]